MTRRVRIARKTDVQPGQLLGIHVEGEDIVLCQVAGQYWAVSNACTHLGWPLSEGYLSDDLIICSLHGAAFDPQTGKCLRLPATRPLKTYQLVETDEELYIELL